MNPSEREVYRLHAKLPVYKRRVTAAIEIVRKAITEARGEWVVCCSGGKDSTAVLSVALEAGWRGDVFHYWHPETPHENSLLVSTLCDQFGLSLKTVRVPGAFDVFEQAGRSFLIPETDEEKRLTREMLRGYKDITARSTNKYTGCFWGLRGEESRNRSIIVATRGPIYQTNDRASATALPIGRWSARDVWARHITEKLPWLDRYDKLPDRERGRSEITWLSNEGLWRYGQSSVMRHSDPELWHRLRDKFPILGEL